MFCIVSIETTGTRAYIEHEEDVTLIRGHLYSSYYTKLSVCWGLTNHTRREALWNTSSLTRGSRPASERWLRGFFAMIALQDGRTGRAPEYLATYLEHRRT